MAASCVQSSKLLIKCLLINSEQPQSEDPPASQPVTASSSECRHLLLLQAAMAASCVQSSKLFIKRFPISSEQLQSEDPPASQPLTVRPAGFAKISNVRLWWTKGTGCMLTCFRPLKTL